MLRYGGSMVNAAGYRWKNMIGPRDHRPPYDGTWYPYSSDGWGIPDFLNFCEAARFLGIPDFNISETPHVSAKRSSDGKILVLDVVNLGSKVTPATIVIHGYSPTKLASVAELAGPLNLVNSARSPNRIYPIEKQWKPDFKGGRVNYSSPPNSLTTIKFCGE